MSSLTTVSIFGLPAGASNLVVIIPALIATIAYYKRDSLGVEKTLFDDEPLAIEYDFIIIGAGSAGEEKLISFQFVRCNLPVCKKSKDLLFKV